MIIVRCRDTCVFHLYKARVNYCVQSLTTYRNENENLKTQKQAV